MNGKIIAVESLFEHAAGSEAQEEEEERLQYGNVERVAEDNKKVMKEDVAGMEMMMMMMIVVVTLSLPRWKMTDDG